MLYNKLKKILLGLVVFPVLGGLLQAETLLSSYVYPERGFYSRSHTSIGFAFSSNEAAYALEGIIARVSDREVPQFGLTSVEPHMSAQILRTADGWVTFEVVTDCSWEPFPNEFTDVQFVPDNEVLVEQAYTYAFVITVAHTYGIQWQTMEGTPLPYVNTGFSYEAGHITKYTYESAFTSFPPATWTLAAKLQGRITSDFSPDPALSGILISHQGANAPGNEGWILYQQGDEVSDGSVTDDLGTGIDAWSLDDNGISPEDHHFFRYYFSPLEQRYISENGWRLTLRIRITDLPTIPVGSDAGQNSIAVEIRTGQGSRDFDLVLGYEVNHGVPSILTNGIATMVEDYALIEVEYSPQVSSASQGILTMSVNGNHRYNFTNAQPNGSGVAQISWGSLGGATTGQANWAEVTFEVRPPITPPKIKTFQLTASGDLSFHVTNVARGVYYSIEKSNDLVNWDFIYGIRPNTTDDFQYTRDKDMDGDRSFYRIGIK